MNPEGVTKIVKCLKPNAEKYLEFLTEYASLQEVNCHQSFEYPAAVESQKCWAHFGIFYDYLVRREIYVLLKKEAFDKRAEMYKSALDQFTIAKGETKPFIYKGIRFSINYKDIDKVRKFLASYEIFKNIEYRSIDILKDIYNTSMLHMMSYGKPTIPYDPDFINQANVKEVLKYVRTWNLKNIKINPRVCGKFFHGDADLIFHDSIMEMKVSKNDPPWDTSSYQHGLNQMIFYALGLYIEKGQEITTFKIYNPLLGVMYVFEIPPTYLNFDQLRWNVDNEPCWKNQ